MLLSFSYFLTLQASAAALATGIGSVSSSAVCVYGNATLNNDCPLPCQGLLLAIVGDCYCRNPNYQPSSIRVDPKIKNMTVYQMYLSLATSRYFRGATCRNWLNEPDNQADWNCKNSSRDW
eukprot:TRINITY_DN1224_c0_g1_i1.p1 TRINITY_DN1224_c0_g1~~TRINITY_DN1224_c0_g1_i1.p1  ORF type:complete len:121 (-),score=18.42 TRINITY_DN1224_c0_g1_i1:113-475(-)